MGANLSLQKTISVDHLVAVVSIAMTIAAVEATVVMEVAVAMTTVIEALATTTIAILAPQDMDAGMTMAPEASIATHQAVMIATAAATTIAVGETTHEMVVVMAAVAMETHLQEIHIPEVETTTCLLTIGTPAARAPC